MAVFALTVRFRLDRHSDTVNRHSDGCSSSLAESVASSKLAVLPWPVAAGPGRASELGWLGTAATSKARLSGQAATSTVKGIIRKNHREFLSIQCLKGFQLDRMHEKDAIGMFKID
jgi:hypothetical protein